MRIVLIDNYDSFTFVILHYLKKRNNTVNVIRNDKFKIKDLAKYDKIVISPGPGDPNDAGKCLHVVKNYYNKKPILGICLGHQVIGQAFGGNIIRAKKVMHGKISEITLQQKGIFKNMPHSIKATRYHSLIIDSKTLNKSFEITAKTHDNIIMAIQHTNLPIFGIQFHPESFKTNNGQKIIDNFLSI